MANRRENEVRRLRVIVALNACRRDLGGLEIAARWAADQGCDLEAWFVEEINLLNVAELPFTKEITRSSAIERDFDALRIERAQRSCLAQIRQAIDRLNQSSSVRANLRILRGHLTRTVSIIDEGVAVLVLSRRGETRSGRTAELGLMQAGHRTARADTETASVCVLVDGSEDSWRALQAASDIAASQQTRLTIAFPAERQELIGEARNHAIRSGHAADLRIRLSPVEFDPPMLIRYLRQSGCRLLVAKRSDWELLEPVAEAAECPVVLV